MIYIPEKKKVMPGNAMGHISIDFTAKKERAFKDQDDFENALVRSLHNPYNGDGFSTDIEFVDARIYSADNYVEGNITMRLYMPSDKIYDIAALFEKKDVLDRFPREKANEGIKFVKLFAKSCYITVML